MPQEQPIIQETIHKRKDFVPKMRKRNMSCTFHPSLLVAEHAGLEP